jgi:hypothetical protein
MSQVFACLTIFTPRTSCARAFNFHGAVLLASPLCARADADGLYRLDAEGFYYRVYHGLPESELWDGRFRSAAGIWSSSEAEARTIAQRRVDACVAAAQVPMM